MIELQLFNNKEFGEIRVLKIKCQPWFVGKDVAKVLDYNEPNKAIARHVDEDDRMFHPIMDNLGRKQESWIINESGLYSLILSSKLPNAKKFKRWVTSEVLPQIRQTGGYIPFSEGESDEEFLARALIIAQKTLDKKNKLIEEMTPRIAYLDKIQGYTNPSKAVSTHCKHIRKETIDVSSQNGNAHKARKTQEVSLINEGDVYRLIVKSKLPKALGYANTSKAIKDHCMYITKRYIPHPQSKNKSLEVNIIPEGDIYRLIIKSKLPKAQEFGI